MIKLQVEWLNLQSAFQRLYHALRIEVKSVLRIISSKCYAHAFQLHSDTNIASVIVYSTSCIVCYV